MPSSPHFSTPVVRVRLQPVVWLDVYSASGRVAVCTLWLLQYLTSAVHRASGRSVHHHQHAITVRSLHSCAFPAMLTLAPHTARTPGASHPAAAPAASRDIRIRIRMPGVRGSPRTQPTCA